MLLKSAARDRGAVRNETQVRAGETRERGGAAVRGEAHREWQCVECEWRGDGVRDDHTPHLWMARCRITAGAPSAAAQGAIAGRLAFATS